MGSGVGSMPDSDAERLKRRRESREKYRAAHPDRVRQSSKDNLARRRARLEVEEHRRAADRARAREWAAAYPDRARERSRAWSEQHPERRRELQRDYYRRNAEDRRRATRDQNTRRRQNPAQREQERQYQAERRDVRNAQQTIRRSDPEIRERQNQDQNERRRRERRRRQLGLPPRLPHRTTLNAREENASAARAFFSQRRGPRAIRLLREEQAEVRAAAWLGSEACRAEGLMALIEADARRPALLTAAVNEILSTEVGARLREEVRMDSIARRLRGATPYPDAEAEALRRALAALTARHPPRPERVVPPRGGRRKTSEFRGEQQRTPTPQLDRSMPSI